MATLIVQPNTTVKLTPGVTYDQITGLVGPHFALPNGCKLLGRENQSQPFPIITGQTPEGYRFKVNYSGFACKGIRFDVGGVFVEGQNGVNDGFKWIDNEVHQAAVGGSNRQGLRFSTRMNNFEIRDSLWKGKNGYYSPEGIYTHDALLNGVMANLEFEDLWCGMHMASDAQLENLLIEQIYMRRVRKAFEWQGKSGPIKGLIFQDLWVEDNHLSPVLNDNRDAYSYSLPLEGGDGVIIRRCISIQKKSADAPDGKGVRIIYEVGGENLDMYDCYSRGGNHVVAGNGAQGSGKVHDCKFLDYREGPRNANGNTTQYINCGPNTVLSAEMQRRLTEQDKPGRFKRYGATPIPPIPPTTPPTVLTTPTDADVMNPGESVTATGTGQNLRWEVDREGDGMPELAKGPGPSITFTIPTDSTENHRIRIRLFGDGGNVEARWPIIVPVVDDPVTSATVKHKSGILVEMLPATTQPAAADDPIIEVQVRRARGGVTVTRP